MRKSGVCTMPHLFLSRQVQRFLSFPRAVEREVWGIQELQVSKGQVKCRDRRKSRVQKAECQGPDQTHTSKVQMSPKGFWLEELSAHLIRDSKDNLAVNHPNREAGDAGLQLWHLSARAL